MSISLNDVIKVAKVYSYRKMSNFTFLSLKKENKFTFLVEKQSIHSFSELIYRSWLFRGNQLPIHSFFGMDRFWLLFLWEKNIFQFFLSIENLFLRVWIQFHVVTKIWSQENTSAQADISYSIPKKKIGEDFTIAWLQMFSIYFGVLWLLLLSYNSMLCITKHCFI